MKRVITLIFALSCAVSSAQTVKPAPAERQVMDTPKPLWKGLQCIGWTKPTEQALADGDTSGEELAVNTPLTENEKRRLYYARQHANTAWREEQAVEEDILAKHRLLFPLRGGIRVDTCGITPMIRVDDYHITQFVPSNPAYPGSGTPHWNITDTAYCRAHFAEQRKSAVPAAYGVEDKYQPKEKK